MDAGAKKGGDSSSTPAKPSKFSVYQNQALSVALTTKSLRPSSSTFFCILSLCSASSFALLSTIVRKDWVVDSLRLQYFSQDVAYFLVKFGQTVTGLVLIGTVIALIKAISLWRATGIATVVSSNGKNEQVHLTSRQLGLVGMKQKIEERAASPLTKPPKSKFSSPSPQDMLVPLHQPRAFTSNLSQISNGRSDNSSGSKISFRTPTKMSGSPSSYLVAASTQSPAYQTSPVIDQLSSNSPWFNKGAYTPREIVSEQELENFLADVDDKIYESAGKLATPPPTIRGFGMVSPNSIATSTNTSGTTRSTPLRPVRMSPVSQKFNTPPKKGEGDLPPPMSMEESVEAFERLGIYSQIEQWRDRLRQWFSSVLLNPLVNKIETSHLQVMQSAARLGITVAINPVGYDLQASGTQATISPIERPNEWQSAFSLDEDGLLHQLRATLVQALDTSSKFPVGNLQLSSQQSIMHECIDAITEHQKLLSLMKGEWAKGLLPQSSIRADYTVQRIRELAEGTCLRNYEFTANGQVYDKANKKWTLELPTDSHLLLYLFCAFLEHPKWMLHVDPSSYAGVQSSKNPLFLGVLPSKERFPEKYVAVICGVPSVLHPGATVLAVDKQRHPIIALYWDKKPHFSLQGRTAVWDSILLLCNRVKTAYGGVIRGMQLSSSALEISSVLDSGMEG
ncbi:uncharacterized protein LOC124936069 [Impatiens glandulifera]|uniref:uncharacterized protein LOC124936069 n=1 Tax=Impatiens glandulifera TaxID=253017 RepID=UPI001FB05780|nr:uncharacterized protein LOC124936069 [Impatiens glandulifera]